MSKEKVVTINERIPSLKEQRKQRANRRLLFFLSFFFLLLLLLVYFQSPLSHVRHIEVVGNNFLSDEEIIKTSKITDGTSIWNIDKDLTIERLKDHIEISDASITRKFPNSIRLTVKEYTRIGYLVKDDKYYPILETGHYLSELTNQQVPADAPSLLNFEEGEALVELSAELTMLPSSLIERISEIVYSPSENDPLAIRMFMTDGIEVHTTIRNFAEKMVPYPSIIKQLEQGKEGILHMKMSPYFEEFQFDEEDVESEGEG